MAEQLRVAGIIQESIVDGPGIRMSVFAQGCPHHCPGCHNPQTHDFEGGTLTDLNDIVAQFKANPLLKGITFTGGEPFCQADKLAVIGKEVHAMGKDVMTYTGYTFEQLLERNKPDEMALLQETDILVDGPFIKEEKNMTLLFRGSKNQRILDVKQSLKQGKAVIVDWQR